MNVFTTDAGRNPRVEVFTGSSGSSEIRTRRKTLSLLRPSSSALLSLTLLFLSLPLHASQHQWYDLYRKGLEYFQHHDYTCAIVFFEMAIHDEDKADDKIAFDLEFVDYTPNYLIAECHYQQGKNIIAGDYVNRNELNAALYYQKSSLRNQHRPAIRKKSIDRLLELAEDFKLHHQYGPALILYEFLNRDPQFHFEGIIDLLKARNAYLNNDFATAVREFLNAEQEGYLRLDDQDPAASAFWLDYFWYAQSLWRESPRDPGMADAATTMLRKLLTILIAQQADAEKIRMIHQLFGEIAIANNNVAEGIRHFRQMVPPGCECECFESKLKIADMVYELGLKTQNSPLLEQATISYSDLLRCSIKTAPLNFSLGSLALIRGDGATALSYFETARSTGLDVFEVVRIIAALHANLGEFDAARGTLDQFVRTGQGVTNNESKVYRDLFDALDYLRYDHDQQTPMTWLSSLSGPLVKTMVSSPASAKFHFLVRPGPRIVVRFSVGSTSLDLADGFEVNGLILDFKSMKKSEPSLTARILAKTPFQILKVTADVPEECLSVTTSMENDNQLWIITVTGHPGSCQLTELAGVIKVQTDLADHEEIVLTVRGKIPRSKSKS